MEVTDTQEYIGGSFGTILRAAREAQNIDTQTAAADIFIKERQLVALEEENFDALPQQTFARGFAVNYAKYLGVDHHDIAERFNQVYPVDKKVTKVEDIESPLKPMGTLHRDNDSSGAKLRFNPFLLLAAIGVIALAVFLLRTINNAEKQTNAEEEMPVVEETISVEQQQQGAAITPAASGIAVDANTEVATDNTAEQTQAQTQIEAGAAVVQSVEGNDSIELWVRNNTNITIVDANNQTVMSGTHSRGGYTIKGTAPFKVQIDKADNVAINLNKQPIKLAPFTQNNQANFELK